MERRIFWQPMGVLAFEEVRADTAAIMIRNPYSWVPAPRFAVQLDLVFWDVSSLDLVDVVVSGIFGGDETRCVSVREALRGTHGWPFWPPMRIHARRVAHFVEELPAEITTLRVACEKGKSRSRAVAEWASMRTGWPAEGDRSGTPNRRLAALLARRA